MVRNQSGTATLAGSTIQLLFRLLTGLFPVFVALALVGCGSGNSGGAGNTPAPTPPVASSSCNSSTGLREPLPECSPETPCTRVASELGVPMINTSEVIPACDSQSWDERLTLTVMGASRHACIIRPSQASSISRRPLVVWFHPGGAGSADTVELETQLLSKAPVFDLTNDVSNPGFILLSIQGRNLRFPTASPRDGHHHDFYHRDLNSPSANPDIANADAFIDAIVEEGIVNTDRIHVMGWSNGAFFAQLYAIARHTTTTPGGNRIASAAVFSAASPFDDVSWDVFDDEALDGDDTSCKLPDIPVSSVPVLMVYRTSDAAVACNSVQSSCFQTEPGYDTEQWISDASNRIQIQGLRIGGIEPSAVVAQDTDAFMCSDFSLNCPVVNCQQDPNGDGCLSLINHLRWPDGIYGSASSGVDREIDMLQFLKDNSL